MVEIISKLLFLATNLHISDHQIETVQAVQLHSRYEQMPLVKREHSAGAHHQVSPLLIFEFGIDLSKGMNVMKYKNEYECLERMRQLSTTYFEWNFH